MHEIVAVKSFYLFLTLDIGLCNIFICIFCVTNVMLRDATSLISASGKTTKVLFG